MNNPRSSGPCDRYGPVEFRSPAAQRAYHVAVGKYQETSKALSAAIDAFNRLNPG